MKLSMYVKARNLIASTKPVCDHVCVALLQALVSEMGLYVAYEDAKEILEEFFPEFFELHDGYWGRDMFHVETGKHRAWWPFDWKEPRLVILDFIINNRLDRQEVVLQCIESTRNTKE